MTTASGSTVTQPLPLATLPHVLAAELSGLVGMPPLRMTGTAASGTLRISALVAGAWPQLVAVTAAGGSGGSTLVRVDTLVNGSSRADGLLTLSATAAASHGLPRSVSVGVTASDASVRRAVATLLGWLEAELAVSRSTSATAEELVTSWELTLHGAFEEDVAAMSLAASADAASGDRVRVTVSHPRLGTSRLTGNWCSTRFWSWGDCWCLCWCCYRSI
jgi:hypothetical protein